MKLKSKILLAFLLVSSVSGLVGYIGINASKKIFKEFYLTETIHIPSIIATVEIKAAARHATIKAIEYSLRGDKNDRSKTFEALADIDANYKLVKEKFILKTREEGGYSHPIEQALLNDLSGIIINFKQQIGNYITSKDQGLNTEQIFSQETTLHASRKELIQTTYRLIDHMKEELDLAKLNTNAAIANTIRLLLAVTLFDVTLAIIIGLILSRFISWPMNRLSNAANKISSGDLTARVEISSSDEIGQLAASFNLMAEQLQINHTHLEDLVKSRTRELDKYREQMEILVEKRTNELLQTNAILREEITERKEAEAKKEQLINELQQAANEIKTLRGIVPICSYCKQIRDDKGFWNQVESYVRDHTEAEFSHGICPDCAKKHWPDVFNGARGG